MIFTMNDDQLTIEPIAQELTPIAHDRARAIGALQPTPALRKQAYLNTLAVYAVHYHLLYDCDIWSEPEASDSTHPIYQMLDGAAGVALARDLLIPKIGKVDCCALLPNQTTIAIPAETLSDRAAYVVVQFHQDTLEEVDLLGFFTSFDPSDPYTEVTVGDEDAGWRSMDDLSRVLDEYQRLQDFKNGDHPLIETLRSLENSEGLDILFTKCLNLGRQANSQDRLKEKFLVALSQGGYAPSKSLGSSLQVSDREFEVKGSNSEIVSSDLSDIADQLATKFAEILGIIDEKPNATISFPETSLVPSRPSIILPNFLEADAVVPQCLDNQCVSNRVFQYMVTNGVDYTDPKVMEMREQDFKNEFIRSLVYSSQVVIQRAFFTNSDFLFKNYSPSPNNPNSRDNLEAFAKLMRDRTIIPYLHTESSLRDKFKFGVRKDGEAALQSLLSEVGDDITCVRLGIDDEQNQKNTKNMNADFVQKLTRLSGLFRDQCPELLQELGVDLNAVEPEVFYRRMKEFGKYAFDKNYELSNDNEHLTRSAIYQELLMVQEPDATQYGKFKSLNDEPLLFAIKKYVDLAYISNLPDALKRYAITPVGLPSRKALLDTYSTSSTSSEKLIELFSDSESIESLRRHIMTEMQKPMRLPRLDRMNIADVIQVRSLPQWSLFRESQLKILNNPLQSQQYMDEFKINLAGFQQALSIWFTSKYPSSSSEERYISYPSFTLNILGHRITVGETNSQDLRKLLNKIDTQITRNIQGYTVELTTNVYDLSTQKVDWNRSHTVQIMISAPPSKEEVQAFLNKIIVPEGLPRASRNLASQGKQ